MTDHQTLRDKVLASLPPDTHAAFLRLALDAGINAPDDPAWGDVSLAYAASVSAASAMEAADTVKAETAKIPDTMYHTTIKAASDIKAIIGAEVRERGVELGQGLAAAIRSAADTGANALKAAAADLPAAAAARQDEIIKEWRAALAMAAKDEASGALAARMARSWGTVVLSLTLAFTAGAGGALIGARLLGFLLLHDVTVTPLPGGGQVVIFPPGRPVRQAPPTAGCPGGDVCIQN